VDLGEWGKMGDRLVRTNSLMGGGASESISSLLHRLTSVQE